LWHLPSQSYFWQSNLLDNLDQRQHRAPHATGPMPPIRHVMSDDIHLIP
jgi:hypothetical protein